MTNLKKLFACIALVCVFALPAFNTLYANAATSPIKKLKVATTDDTPLKAFEGIYQMKDNQFTYFQISVVNDKLVGKRMESDQPPITLTRKSDLNFEIPDDDGDETIPVVFTKNDAGEIIQATLGGKQMLIKVKKYVPAKEVKFTAAQLKAFEGKFEFEQKPGTFLQITATADGLTLKQMWDGREVPFMSLGNDVFLNNAAGFPLKFSRDANGNVIKVLAFNRDMWDKVKE